MYRAYQPSLPSANLYLQEKWDRTRYEEHRRKVLMATPAVDTKGFPTPTHLLVNLKKAQMEKQLQALVERQNKIHSSKLNAIRESHGLLDNWNTYSARSLNSGYRLQTMVEITQENGRMLDRISRRESEYRKWQSQWAKVEQLRENISRYPRTSELVWGSQQRVKFLDFKKNSDVEDFTDGSETQMNHRREKKRAFKSAQLLKSGEMTGRGSTNSSSTISCNLPKTRAFITHQNGSITKKGQNNFKESDDNFENIKYVSSRDTGPSQEEWGSGSVLSKEQETAVLWKQKETSSCLSDRRVSLVDDESDRSSYFSPLNSGVSPRYPRKDLEESSLPSPTESPEFTRPMSSLSQETYVGSPETGLALQEIEMRSEMSSQGEEYTLVDLSQGLKNLSFLSKGSKEIRSEPI